MITLTGDTETEFLQVHVPSDKITTLDKESATDMYEISCITLKPHMTFFRTENLFFISLTLL